MGLKWKCPGCDHENSETSTDYELGHIDGYLWNCENCDGLWGDEDNWTVNHNDDGVVI